MEVIKMTKYNLSQIMTTAWNFKRTLELTISEALKKSWAVAKAAIALLTGKDEKMKTNEIKALIDKYHLIERDGKIGSYVRVADKEAMRAEVLPHKAEIVAYLQQEKKVEQEKYERRQNTFAAIPGVAEIEEARSQRANWNLALSRMMETGSSKMPYIACPTPEEIEALENRYPMAVFALEAQKRAAHTENDVLSKIWNDTYDAIRDGQDIKSVKEQHDQKMAEFAQKHVND